MTKPIAKVPIAKTRLLLVDDHFFVRAGLAVSLNGEPDLAVVGGAGDGAEALTQFRALQPDVVLMDGRLPGAHGCEVIALLRAEFPGARVILLSIDDTEEDVARALDAGAMSYLGKSTPREELLRAIRAVASDAKYLPTALAERHSARARRPTLTPREQAVLQLLVRGTPNKSIATELGITEMTVKTHVSHIFEKLGVEDRTSATMAALQRGLARQ